MNSVQKFMTSLKKMDNWVKYIIGIGVMLLLFSIFWPRNNSMGVKLVPVSGSSYYKAVFEGFSNDEKIKLAMENNKPTMAFFYAPWCPHCKTSLPLWNSFQEENNKDNVNIVSIDCTKEENKEIAKKHGVNGYPTIKYLPNGLSNPSGVVDFNGPRTKQGFSSFLSEQSNV
jgi:thiol-disulfide isomerase/thioredoxin